MIGLFRRAGMLIKLAGSRRMRESFGFAFDEEDVMSRRRNLVLLSIMPAWLALSCGSIMLLHILNVPAHADSLSSWTAEDVDLSLPCFDRVVIKMDAQHPRLVTIEGPRHGVSVSAHLLRDQGATRVALNAPSCQAGHSDRTFSLRIGSEIGVTLHDSPHTRYFITGRLASLEANLADGSVSAEEVASLDINIRGSQNMSIARLERAGQVIAAGASRLFVRQASLDALSATLSDHAVLQIDSGYVSALTLTTSDAASARIAGTLDTAIVTANGVNAVYLPHVTGQLARHGTGSIVQTNPLSLRKTTGNPPEAPKPQPTPTHSVETPAQSQPADILVKTTVANDLFMEDRVSPSEGEMRPGHGTASPVIPYRTVKPGLSEGRKSWSICRRSLRLRRYGVPCPSLKTCRYRHRAERR